MTNRRKQVIINKKFQQHYAVVSVAVTVLLTNVFILFQALVPGEQVVELSFGTAWGIGAVELVLVLGAWFGALRASHKVAGPVFVFERQIEAVAAGNLRARISLRKDDMFREEADAINASLDRLQHRVESLRGAARAVLQARAGSGATPDQFDALERALAGFDTDAGENRASDTGAGAAMVSAAREGGFTIIELMVIVAIVSILAVIALPIYQNYTIRSKVSEALAFAAEARSSVTERYATLNSMPADNDTAGLPPPDSYDEFNYLRRLEISSTPVQGTIVVTLKLPGTSADSKQLQLVPSTTDSPVRWTCEPVAGPTGVSENQIPANCRG